MKKWRILILLVLLVILIKAKMVNIEDIQSNYGGVQYIRKPSSESNYVISDETNTAKFDLKERLNNDINQIYTDSTNRIVYLYLVYDTYYRKLEIDYDTVNYTPLELLISNDIKKIYYSFPEYNTVRAITYNDSELVDYETEITTKSVDKSNDSKGGESKRRVFSQSKFELMDEQIVFKIYNAFQNDEINENTESFGSYVFVLRVE